MTAAEKVREEESGEREDEPLKTSLDLVEVTLVSGAIDMAEDLVDCCVDRRSGLGALRGCIRPLILLLELPIARSAKVSYLSPRLSWVLRRSCS